MASPAERVLLAAVICGDHQLHPFQNYHASKPETCKAGSTSANLLQVTSYNTFMLWCAGEFIPCEPENLRAVRAPKIPQWFANRNDDIVFFQEMWSFSEEIKAGMLDAGYCGQTTSSSEDWGSGLGIFTKFEILETEFIEWCDVFGCGDAPSCGDFLNLEAQAIDKGVLYAKIQHPDGSIIHGFNTHAQSNSVKNEHSTRIQQFQRFKEFIDSFNIPQDEFVLFGGDLNEDIDCSAFYDIDCPDTSDTPYCSGRQYYDAMLGILNAQSPNWEDHGNGRFTYNSDLNQLLAKKYDGKDCQEHYLTLDYMLYSNNHKKPNLDTSKCHVERATDPAGNDLSDHLPLTCTYDFSPDKMTDLPIYVTVSYIECIQQNDNWFWQDDEIVVAVDGQQAWPGPDPSRRWVDFETGENVDLLTDEKKLLKRNIHDFPVYCLGELDNNIFWDEYSNFGCIQWNQDRYLEELGFSEIPTDDPLPSIEFVWDKAEENDPGIYKIVFDFAYAKDWTS